MKVLVGTPCGGGVATVQYMLSFIETLQQAQNHKNQIGAEVMKSAHAQGFDEKNPQHQQSFQLTMAKHSVDVALYTLAGESLLQRGRNHIAQVCLTQGFDKLFFIDADAGWSWNQFMKIVSSPHPLTAGICPLKVYPISMNYLPFAEDEKYFTNAQRSMESTKKMAEGHGSSLVKVPFVGTAFMCIDRKVLMKLAETRDHYVYPNPYTGQAESHWDFFKVESVKDTYLSEDWSFCDAARKAGFDVYIDTDVVITHTGNHTFKAG